LLVYANKQDLKSALTSTEISNALALTTLKQSTQWHIQVLFIYLFIYFLIYLS